jgi:DNA repair exonuclease SbcCD ATPase subunit
VDAWTFSRDHGHWRNTSGSEEDWDDAQDAIDKVEGDVLWFRRGPDQYVVTDTAAMKDLAEIFAPQEQLGQQQGALGAKQGELGRIQGELGRRQGDLGRIQARLSQRQAIAQVARVSRDRRGDDADEVEAAMREIQRLQNEAGDLQAELGEEQARLGERQGALGEQQAALGREQQRVSKQVSAALDKLTRELITNGKARRINR